MSRFVRPPRLGIGAALLAASLGLGVLPARASTDLPPASPNLQTIPAGSLVIPMDSAKQNLDGTPFNLKAYGLVTQLLWNDIPVRWSIRAGKQKDQPDFTAMASRVFPSVLPAASLSFSAGPFIILARDVAAAQPVITSFGSNVAVYKLAAATTVDVRYTLLHKPKVAVLNDGGNAPIHRAILDAAGFVSGVQYGEISATTLTTINANSCFTIASEPHFDAGTSAGAADPQAEAIRAFALSGGNFLAQCVAAPTYENDAEFGHFQSTAGIVGNNSSNGSYTYPSADFSFSQFDGALKNANGSVNDFELAPGSTFRNGAHAHVANAPQPNLYVATAAKLGAGTGGMVFYLGGHSYGAAALDDINGLRMYLNAVLTPALRPPPCDLDFTDTPNEIHGKVSEDVDGNGDLSDGVGRPGTTVRLYLDGGDGVPSGADDTLVGSTTTDIGGDYGFTGLLPGSAYWVAVDSRTISPSAGLNATATTADAWPEETYGPAGARCDDGAGGTSTLIAPGPCFGGKSRSVSDQPATLGTSEHVVLATPGTAGRHVDFGFSFATIVTTRDGDDDGGATPRTIQGSLRQFLLNANAVAGAQRSMFRLRGGADPGGSWRIVPTQALPVVSDAVVLDGSTQTGFAGAPLVELDGSQGRAGLVVTGGGSTIRSLAVNRFIGAGITFDVAGGNRLEGCYVGTDVTGVTPLANGDVGVLVGSNGNTIGGTTAAARNVISGNAKPGLKIDTGATGNVVQGNFIGTNATGTAGLGNNDVGIDVRGPGNTIGGIVAGAGNVVSNNNRGGIKLNAGNAGGNTIQGNLIGTNAAGGAALGNAGPGIDVRSAGNTIGGTTAPARNVIAANSAGVSIAGNGATGNVIQGNFIGTDTAGSAALGNTQDGIAIDTASNNTVGGTVTGAGNVIANSGGAGISITRQPVGNALRGNSIHDNAALGIDLGGDGVTPNDNRDTDGGPNDFQNFPLLTSVTVLGGTTTIVGTLNSTPGTTFALDFFASAAPDPSNYGEGQRYLGSSTAVTDGNGNASFTAVIAASLSASEVVSATATAPDNSTSEFSLAFTFVPVRGTIVEDVNGDGDLADAVGRPSVSVRLYQDGGDGQPTGADDVLYGTTTTDAAGAYQISNVRSGTYWVVADSKTVTPSAGPNSGASQGDLWPEQTYGVAGAFCDNGAGGVATLAAPGACYGGRRSAVSDNAAALATSEHVARITVVDTAVSGVDFAFSYAVVVSTRDGDDDVTAARTIQGSFRQLVQNGNGVIGAATSLFRIPRSDPGYNGTGNGEYTIKALSPFPDIADPMIVDGSTQPGWGGRPIVELNGKNAGNAANGLRVTAGSSAIRSLVIDQFKLNGIELSGAGGDRVEGCYIGTTVSGAAALANSRHGIDVLGGNHTIGGTTAAAANVISGNGLDGIHLSGAAASGNTVLGNLVGTNSAGTLAVKNSSSGVEIAAGATANRIGGPAAGARNVCSGNNSHGIHITGSGTNANIVEGNYVGTTASGSSALQNGGDGILIDLGASVNTIGGTTTGSGNVVSGNHANGIEIDGSGTSGNVIQGNSVGVNAAGSAALGNVAVGVLIANSAANTSVGGAVPGAGNVVSGNGDNGVEISGNTPANGNVVQGNFIGTDATGAVAIGNARIGVDVETGIQNQVGGTASGTANTIAWNGRQGVVVNGNASACSIRRNAIHDNGLLGIDLKSTGITPDDLNDVDIGPNDLQNFPVLNSIATGGGTTIVTGTLNSTPNGTFTLEFFSSPSPDPLGYGEGQTYLGTATATTDAAGNASFTASLAAAVPAGHVVTSTATNAADKTSEFSAAKAVTALADLDISKSDGVASYTPGGTVTYTIAVKNLGPSDVTGATVADALPAAIVSASWTCAAQAGASCTASGTGNIADTIGLPAGKSVTYTVTGTISPAPTGNLVNSATVGGPVGVTDPVLGNNSATDTDAQGAAVADLDITKTDGQPSYIPGGSTVYTIIVRNAGPSNVTGASVTDVLPVVVSSASWTCAPSPGASCSASGSGNVNDVANLPAAGYVTYTVTATIASSATGNLVNTAVVAAPGTVTDPTPGNNASTDVDTVGTVLADLGITNTDGVTSYTPGESLTYTIVVHNAGPNDAVGATVTDVLPASVTGASWTCTPDVGASCTASGNGSINDTVNLPAGKSLTYTLSAAVVSSATGDLVNAAHVAAPAAVGDPVAGNNSATDTDTRGTPSAELSVTKTDGVASYTPGGAVTYTITVSNAGPSDAVGATVTDTLPAIVTGASWTCTPSASATCSASGTGNIGDTVNVPAGKSVVYTLIATISPSATTNLVNTAIVAAPGGMTDPTPGNNSATDTDTPGAAVADLSIVKTDGATTYTPGGTVTYTITVANAGPSNASGAAVVDTLPAIVTSASWTCAPSASATCTASGTGNIADTVNLPAGQSIVYTLTATISPSAATSLVNTATVAAPTGVTDPAPGNDASSDLDTPGATTADLSVTTTDGVATYTPGGTVTYTITVANAGPSDVTAATVVDALPASVTGASWTCAPGAGASCTASGTGSINDTVDIPTGKSVVYTLTATISPSATADLVNTATVSAPANATDPALANNSATDTDTRGAALIDLSVDKTAAITEYTPGGTVTYTITVGNAGPSDASGATVTDTLSAMLTGASWTCTPGADATCTASGTGSINDTVTIPAGRNVAYTLTATIASSASGDLRNTSTVAAPSGSTDPTPDNNASSVVNGPGGLVADLGVTTSDGVTSYTPGGTVTYTLTVANAGPSDVSGAAVADALPAIVTSASWTCVPGVGATCTANGTGNVNDTVNVPAGTSVVYTLTATISSSAAADLVNTATVTAPTSVTDANPGNNASIDTDARGAVVADLSISTSDGEATYTPGGTAIYTITAANAGPSDATGATIENELPAILTGASWTCAAAVGASCAASGNGGISDIVNLPAGKSVVYTVTATISSAAATDLVNTATITAPAGVTDTNAGNNSSTDTDTRATAIRLAKTASQTAARIGDPVGYVLTATNGFASPLAGVTLQDLIPAGFKFVANSARLTRAGLDGTLGTPDDVNDAIATSGVRPLVFGPFDLAPHEAVEVSYALRVGSGAGQGDHDNVAEPFQGGISAGSSASARVTIVADPVFDQSTIVGKVYEDRNRNDWQDAGEEGVAQAMVVLDDGTYVLTDAYGRFHFPATNPGQRMVKLNLTSLPPGAEPAGEESRILWVTPGVPVRADFGVILPQPAEKKIGSPGERGVQVSGALEPTPIEIRGSMSDVTVLVNDTLVPLSTSDVKLEVKPLDEIIQLVGNALPQPVTFRMKADAHGKVERWSLDILDTSERAVRTIEGEGALPDAVSWDATTSTGELVSAGQVYKYQLSLRYADGTSSQSSKRIFGVNRETVLSVELTGDAFATGKAELTAGAKKTLDRAAAILAEYPREKVVIEGHTDSVGSSESNLELSKKRAESARDYLVGQRGVSAERLTLQWFGEQRPKASNDLAEGRAVNRRVEIKGEVQRVEGADLNAHIRAEPFVYINNTRIPIAESGRFAASVLGDDAQDLEVEIANGQGRTVFQRVDLPDLKLELPQGEVITEQGAPNGRCTRSAEGIVCRVQGTTEAGNSLLVDGKPVAVAADGRFSSELAVGTGKRTYPVIVRNPAGVSRGANLVLSLADHDGTGDPVVVSQAIPNLTLRLPPDGSRLPGRKLRIEGETEPGNQVTANGQALEVASDGRIQGTIDLPAGRSRAVVDVKDKDGGTGRIESEYDVPRNELFMLALADGEFGKMSGKGLVESAGKDKAEDYYSEGRVAFYLKGVIAGKYLITSSFDSDRQNNGTVFKDLNGTEGSRLLTNLDPDRYYPVYGDDSTLVYDVESQGKFYLALDSDTMSAVVGDYPLAFKDTELAAYQRTLYGARYAYRSLARTKYGDPDTSVIVFGAQVRQAHVRDELRATGGSLYYLSHQAIVEGSEQVTLVIRDKNTRLLKSQEPQRQNIDYTIKYPEGRVMFLRPVASIAQSGSITDQSILAGDPVYIQVDYEAAVQGFEKSAMGARARQQVGDHVAVGTTFVKDETQGGSYELGGLDTEVKLGKSTRLVAEYAKSAGADALANQSEDGGLSYTQVAVNGTEEGSAFKVAAEVDVGEWFQKPDRYHVRLYYKDLAPGFFSSGNFQEQGTTKLGVNADLALTAKDSLRVRYDQEERTGSGASLPGATKDSNLSSVQWEHRATRWGTTVELFQNVLRDIQGTSLGDSSLAAVRGWMKFSEKITGRMDLQKTVSGVANDQATADLQYQVLPSLALEGKGTVGSRGNSAEAGAVLTLGETNVYLTERTATDQAGNRTATVLGARSPLGASSRIYTEYQWEDTDTGKNAISLVGLQRQWDLGPGFRFVLSGENAHVKSSTTTSSTGVSERDRSALAASVSYEKPETWSVLSRNEIRFDGGAPGSTTATPSTQGKRRQILTFNQFTYKLNADLSLLGKFSYSTTENTSSGVTEAKYDERSLGFAYRPVASDRFNALGRYTHLSDLRPIGAGTANATDRTMDVLSVETIFRISPRVEWAAKLAARAQAEVLAGLGSIKTDTLLTIQRFNVNFWKPFDLGVEYRILRQQQTNDQRQGFLGEFMWKPVKYFRVGLGYNFTDFSDNEFSANDYSQNGWFVRVQGRY